MGVSVRLANVDKTLASLSVQPFFHAPVREGHDANARALTSRQMLVGYRFAIGSVASIAVISGPDAFSCVRSKWNFRCF